MKKRVLKKENLDEFAANLLKAARMTDAEIESIANKTQLFDSVAAKIKAGEKNQLEPEINDRRSFLNFNFRVFGAAAAAIVLMIAAIVFYNRAQNSSETQIAQNEPVAKPQTAIAAEKNALPPVETKQFVKPVAQTAKNVRPNPNSKRPDNRPRKTFVRKFAPIFDVPPVEQTNSAEGKFYALPFADESTDDITQIVRAELSHAELSALGIEFPSVENDDERILTDVIYGANGNPKAFRLIGKL